MCLHAELLSDGVSIGPILDISVVADDHWFGIAEDGTAHWPVGLDDIQLSGDVRVYDGNDDGETGVRSHA